MDIDEDARLCSFDIENMYINIPNLEAINIIESIMKNDLEIVETNKTEIINMLRTILE
jgi:hypothetical protein